MRADQCVSFDGFLAPLANPRSVGLLANDYRRRNNRGMRRAMMLHCAHLNPPSGLEQNCKAWKPLFNT